MPKKAMKDEDFEKKVEKEVERKIKKSCKNWSHSCSSGCGFGYFLGFLGAAIYYVSNTSGFWNYFVAILKALVWPAFLVYDLLKFIGT